MLREHDRSYLRQVRQDPYPLAQHNDQKNNVLRGKVIQEKTKGVNERVHRKPLSVVRARDEPADFKENPKRAHVEPVACVIEVEPVAEERRELLNSQMMPEYRQDIMRHLKMSEHLFAPTNYISSLTEITDQNRKVLVDWLLEIHYKYRMLPQTLYLCVSLLDRFLVKRPQTRRRQVQVVGTCCLLLASKFEEVEAAPTISDLVAVMGEAGSVEEVRETENQVALTLDFSLVVPTPFQFLILFASAADVDHDTDEFFLSMFFLDCTLLDAQFLVLRPQQRAATAFYLACAKLKITKNWAQIWQFVEDDVRYWAQALNHWFPKYKDLAVFRKYKRVSYRNVISMA